MDPHSGAGRGVVGWITGDSRRLAVSACALAYAGAIGFSVAGLLANPPAKTYVIVPGEDWTRCVEIRATSERMARQAAQLRPSRTNEKGDCTPLPAVEAVDPRLVLERSFNASLIVSAILAALWIAGLAIRAWRKDAIASTQES